MKILVWHWGRRGAGPRYAAELAASLRSLDGVEAVLSLSAQAEILRGEAPPPCDLPYPTYGGLGGFIARLPLAPFQIGPLAARLRALRPDVAICAMPSALDFLMAAALRRLGVPMLVVVHDADPHPGDGFPFQMTLQRRLVHRAQGLVVLTGHVADRLRGQGLVGDRRLIRTTHLPLVFGPPPPPPLAHGGPFRLLSFGRLLPYKGLDLLEQALRLLGPGLEMEVRVVGSGPDSPVLEALRALPRVTVENRWVPEPEVGAILAWADGLVLSHREASQSGVAAAAVAAGRWVVATRVGGMTEQLEAEPQALLCAPTAEGVAEALRQMVLHPPPARTPDDPRAQWRDMAAGLVAEIAAMLAARR
ncbi:MAG: glycosyltransferase [Rhodospirillales bacterium]|nr:glycosyltransferase [Rhodospirillales bacterium]